MRSWMIASLLALAVGCATGTPLPMANITNPGALLFNGYTEREVDCYRCHNGDGAGTWRGPALSKRVPKLSDAQIQTTIESGKSFMPPFSGKISQAEIAQIIGWLRTTFPAQADAGT